MVSKINRAITDYLAFLRPVDESEITDEVKKFSKAKTLYAKERGINRNLNALWKKGILEKYVLDDKDNLVKMDLDEKNTLPKVYLLKEKRYLRKIISIDEYIFCGSGKERKEKTEVKIKMWTVEDNRTDREGDLKEKLLDYIQGKYGGCYNPEYPDMYIDEIKELEFYAYDDSEDFPESQVDVIYPETDMVEE